MAAKHGFGAALVVAGLSSYGLPAGATDPGGDTRPDVNFEWNQWLHDTAPAGTAARFR
jgi:hypothetical protein